MATRVAKKTAIPASGDVANPLASALEWLSAEPSFTIVQIGAYVGDTKNDPLFQFLRREFRTRNRMEQGSVALLVEPVREYFDQLVNNCRDLSGLRFENAAVAEETGTRNFYRLSVDPTEYGLPHWLSQLGSLQGDRMTRLWDSYEGDPDLQRFVLANQVTEEVQCYSLSDLLERHQIDRLDLLQIDAEGYDYEILRSIDFDKIRPRFINYERVLLADNETACTEMLRRAGYLLLDWGQDTFCIRMQ